MSNYLNKFSDDELKDLCLLVMIFQDSWEDRVDENPNLAQKLENLDDYERNNLDENLDRISDFSEEYSRICAENSENIEERQEIIENFLYELVEKLRNSITHHN